MVKPLNSPRGLFGKWAYKVTSGTYHGIYFDAYSASSALLSGNTTGLVLAGGVRVSNKSTAVITGNSTGIILSGAVKVANKANGVISANATGITVTAIKVGSKATSTLKVDSTGWLIGTKYITLNTTGTW